MDANMATAKPTGAQHADATVKSHAAKLEAELSALRQIESAIVLIRKVKSQFPSLFEKLKQSLHTVIEEEARKPDAFTISTIEEDESEEDESGLGMLIAYFRNR